MDKKEFEKKYKILSVLYDNYFQLLSVDNLIADIYVLSRKYIISDFYTKYNDNNSKGLKFIHVKKTGNFFKPCCKYESLKYTTYFPYIVGREYKYFKKLKTDEINNIFSKLCNEIYKKSPTSNLIYLTTIDFIGYVFKEECIDIKINYNKLFVNVSYFLETMKNLIESNTNEKIDYIFYPNTKTLSMEPILDVDHLKEIVYVKMYDKFIDLLDFIDSKINDLIKEYIK